jgi:hypothetical protein
LLGGRLIGLKGDEDVVKVPAPSRLEKKMKPKPSVSAVLVAVDAESIREILRTVSSAT